MVRLTGLAGLWQVLWPWSALWRELDEDAERFGFTARIVRVRLPLGLAAVFKIGAAHR